MGSADRASARYAARCLFLGSDRIWYAAIGLVLAALAPALRNQFARTAPSGPATSSIARSATLKRRPASSIMYIFPYAIVTAALSHLAGSSPPAARPCIAWWAGGRAFPLRRKRNPWIPPFKSLSVFRMSKEPFWEKLQPVDYTWLVEHNICNKTLKTHFA